MTRDMLAWAASRLSSDGKRVSRRSVLTLLRKEIALYGSDPDSLFGEGGFWPDAEAERAAERLFPSAR